MTYGIPYKGSKSKIAKDILQCLPAGKRLVDLFGGGFAITHCAMELFDDKWGSFLYNDYNPLLKPLIEDAIAGKYNYDVFTPEWISRERFKEEKEKDGYIKWIWSFGNNGTEYIYGKDIEPIKKLIHDYVVFGKTSDVIDDIGIVLKSSGIRNRRLEWGQNIKKKAKSVDEKVQRLQHLQHLQHLGRLERLQHLQHLGRLEITCMDYRDYVYADGDVVYCDIPYAEDTRPDSYSINGNVFDKNEFLIWAKSQSYPVYYSGYIESEIIWNKKVRTTMSNTSNTSVRHEALFVI